jgi:hypothetical protein
METKDFKSNIFDKFGKEVSVGDVVAFPYIDPIGEIHDEEAFRLKE